MYCLNYCILGSALLGSMVMTMLASKNSKNFKNFRDLLNEKQKNIYKNIIKERFNIYLQGLILGIIIALIATYKIKNSNNKICLFVVISLAFKYLYYCLHPKSTYMLNHLTSVKQNNAWLKIYKEMKYRNIIGFVLGIIGYVLLAKGLC